MTLRAVQQQRSQSQTLKVLTIAQLMTPQQLADYWQIEVATIYTWVSHRKTNARGEVLPFHKVGHLLRFNFDEVVAWAKS